MYRGTFQPHQGTSIWTEQNQEHLDSDMKIKRRRYSEQDDKNEPQSQFRRTRAARKPGIYDQVQAMETPSKRPSSRFYNPSSSGITDGNIGSGRLEDSTRNSYAQKDQTREDYQEDRTKPTSVRQSLRHSKSLQNTGTTTADSTPLSKMCVASPNKGKRSAPANGTPSIVRNADHSARRKSQKTMMRSVLEDGSELDEEEDDIAQQIYGSGEEEDEEEEQYVDEDEEDGIDELATETVNVLERSKSGKRGRPRGSASQVKKRSLSPDTAQNLAPHETYFFHNRPSKSKTSNANISSLALLDHEEYFSLLRGYQDPHAEDMVFLQNLHAKSFRQWHFELRQNFSICLYGLGSKKSLLDKFADHVYQSFPDPSTDKLVIVNGYVQHLTIKDILNTLASAISSQPTRLGSQPAVMLENVFYLLEEDPSMRITLMIHSLDHPSLRRLPTQSIIAQLSAHPQMHLIASTDHPNFPLLWDSSLRSLFNFLFHDCTTFQPYNSVEIDVVNEVHELFGRSGRRVGGKEGVSFVLKSLNENSRNLFRVLVAEILAGTEEGGNLDTDEDTTRVQTSRMQKEGAGVEYRLLYHKAVEEFICSNEMNFRTLLKEFHDHQMIQSRKDALGTDYLYVPFRREELETILEDMTA